MSFSYRFRVFFFLGLVLVSMSVGFSILRHGSQAPAREAWVTVTRQIEERQGTVDSLKALIEDLEVEVESDREQLDRLGDRIAHFERGAVEGNLPSATYREYRRTIDRHNEVVQRHNSGVAELQRVYSEYSALVDLHNTLIDSANRIQRNAVQEGIQLPEMESPVR